MDMNATTLTVIETGRNRSRHGSHEKHDGEPDEYSAHVRNIDERLVFLARAAARYELVKCCVMDLDEAMSGLFEPAGDR